MSQKIHLILYIAILTIVGCTGKDGAKPKHVPQPSDTLYTKQKAMDVYDYQPERALQIVDSAVVVGNMSQVWADGLRARIYNWTLMGQTVEEDAEEEDEPVYHDINIYRTADIDALGAEIKTFTDRLVDAYQNGGDEVRAKIDKVTANAFRINEQQPEYDLIDYAVSLTLALPDVFGSALNSPLGEAFDRSIVYQQSSHWLMENAHTVDLSVLLGCQGHYTLDEGFMQMRFDADGTAYPIFYTGLSEDDAEPWGSTLDATYGQLRFDRLTGWSRWLRLNQQEPNPDCATGYNPFDRRKRK